MKRWFAGVAWIWLVGCGLNQPVSVSSSQEITWGAVQSAAEQSSVDWDWSGVDTVLQAQQAQTAVPIYPYALWDQASCHGDWPSMITIYGEHFQAPYPPCDAAAYQVWLTALIERYHRKVDVWLVLNTPTQQTAPTARFVGPANVYGELAVTTAQAIHQADTGAKVYIGPLEDLSVASVTFYTELLANSDVQANVDGLIIHPNLKENWSAVESILDQTNWTQPTYFMSEQ